MQYLIYIYENNVPKCGKWCLFNIIVIKVGLLNFSLIIDGNFMGY